jgi:ABC-2 type transport system permease protein
MSAFAVAGYEVRRLLRDRALPALLALLLGLSGYAAWNGADWVRQRIAAIDLIKAEEQKTVEFLRDRIAQRAPGVTPRWQPVLPPGSMAPLSIGQAEAYPFAADVAVLLADSQIFSRLSADIGNPTVRAAGRFDLAFVVVFFLPLVILAATYDLWSRERERGVAAMVLSQPVSVAPLIAVKALARGLTVLLPSAAIILAVAGWAGARQPAGVAALALAVLVYGSFWLAVAVIISLFARRSTEAAIAAGAVWLAVVVMVPALTLAVVDLVAPPPSEMRFATELKAREAEIRERQRLYRVANPSPVRTPAPRIPDRMRELYADRVAADRELTPMIEAHQQAKDARRHLLDKVRFLLPSVAVQDALDRIAGSDADRALAFQRQALKFIAERRLWAKERMDSDAPLAPAEFNHLPRFQFREPGSAFQAGVPADLAVLVIATLLILIAAHAFRGQAATP